MWKINVIPCFVNNNIMISELTILSYIIHSCSLNKLMEEWLQSMEQSNMMKYRDLFTAKISNAEIKSWNEKNVSKYQLNLYASR